MGLSIVMIMHSLLARLISQQMLHLAELGNIGLHFILKPLMKVISTWSVRIKGSVTEKQDYVNALTVMKEQLVEGVHARTSAAVMVCV